MPFTPDPPYPKAAGSVIRSKDWNDLVTEAQRLDTVKVNKAGDNLTGPLTIQAALGVGTTAPAAGTRLHVVDSANPTVLRIESAPSSGFGTARLEMWSDPQGGANEWRPSYIQSIDLGSFTGGLAFVTNGAGSAAKTGSVEALRLVNGKAGFGVNDPGFKIDVYDRIRLRQNAASHTAGLWLYQTTPAADRAFIGMWTDDIVGLYGVGAGVGWSFGMSVTNGNVGIKTSPNTTYALTVSGNARVIGRLTDDKIHSEAVASNQTTISNTTNTTVWRSLMSMSVVSPGAYFHIRFQMGGVQGHNVSRVHGEFRLLVDGNLWAYSMNEWHNNGFELRTVSLERLAFLSVATHTVEVQWSVKSPDSGESRLTGCWYGDTRTLIAIEQ